MIVEQKVDRSCRGPWLTREEAILRTWSRPSGSAHSSSEAKRSFGFQVERTSSRMSWSIGDALHEVSAPRRLSWTTEVQELVATLDGRLLTSAAALTLIAPSPLPPKNGNMGKSGLVLPGQSSSTVSSSPQAT